MNIHHAVEDRLCDTLLVLENDKARVISITGWNWIVEVSLIAE
jgi:hypothetical protein